MFQISERLFYLNSLLQEKDDNCFHQALGHLPLILDNFKHKPTFIIKQSVTFGTWKVNIKRILNANIQLRTGCYSCILPTWDASGLPYYLTEGNLLELRNSIKFFWFYRLKFIKMRNCFCLAESLVITVIPFNTFFQSYCYIFK